MLAGMATGIFLRRNPAILKINEKLTSLAIYVLLFLLGISVGLNNTILQHLDQIGFQALLITAGAVSGSVVTLWILYRFIFKNFSPKPVSNEK